MIGKLTDWINCVFAFGSMTLDLGAIFCSFA